MCRLALLAVLLGLCSRTCEAFDLLDIGADAETDSNLTQALLDQSSNDGRRLRIQQSASSGLRCGGYSAPGADVSVVFVHIFKAAGSTMRSIMRKYATECSRSWACLIHCDKEDMIANVTTNKTNHAVRKSVNCQVKDTINAPSQIFDRTPLASSLSGVDIVGGHITFDMKYVFNAVPSRRTLFITVMRLPIISLVSGIRYWYPEWSQQETEAAFRRNISKGELTFANAVQYLVNDYATFGDYTSAAYLQAAANLRRFSLVGLQERMNATMLMLQVWLDPDERCRECWVPEKQNPSKGFKPEELLESLSAEERATVDRMLSKENALYDVGQEMFHSTCHSILGSHGDVCGPKPNKTSSAATSSASSIASGALASSLSSWALAASGVLALVALTLSWKFKALCPYILWLKEYRSV
jgi:hypothetical protein